MDLKAKMDKLNEENKKLYKPMKFENDVIKEHAQHQKEERQRIIKEKADHRQSSLKKIKDQNDSLDGKLK